MVRGDIYLARLNENCLGSEQGGLRPVMIVQNDFGNTFSTNTIVALITSNTHKTNLPTHVILGKELGLKQDSLLLCEQIQTIDKQRLTKYIGHAPSDIFENALKISIGIGV